MDVTRVKFSPSRKNLGKESLVVGFRLISTSGGQSQVVALSPAGWIKTDKEVVLWEGKVAAEKAVVTYGDVALPDHSVTIEGPSYSVKVNLPVCESPGEREDYDLAFLLPSSPLAIMVYPGIFSIPTPVFGPITAVTGFLPSLPGR